MKGYKTYPRPNNVLRYRRTIGCLRATTIAHLSTYILIGRRFNGGLSSSRIDSGDLVEITGAIVVRHTWYSVPVPTRFAVSASPLVKWSIVRPFLISTALELARSGAKPGSQILAPGVGSVTEDISVTPKRGAVKVL